MKTKLKFAIIGAGSVCFCPKMIVDILLSDKIAKIGNRKNLNEYRKNLKNSVIELLNSDLSEMQKAARKEYNSKYSIENMQKKYTELINSL